MQTPSSATLSIVLSVSLGAVFAATPDLPEAVFDRGGNMFDLEKISAARFPIPEGGFSGKASRLKDSDPLQPVVLSVDWAKVRKTAKGGAKGFRLRYRYHNIKPGNGPGRVRIVVRGLATQPDCTRVKNQEDWPIAIFETGNQWADFYLPDVGIRTTSDWMELLLDPCGGFGELEIKDGSSVPFAKDEALDPSKYHVAVMLDVLSMFDGTFTLASGADNLIRFPWRLNDPKLRLERSKLALKIELPAGVRASNSMDDVPGEMMPRRDWNGWYAPFFHLRTDLPPGSPVGDGTVTAWYDGKPCSKPLTVKFAVEAPAVAKTAPKRYFNGACLVSPDADYSSAENLDAFARMTYAAGLRGIAGNINYHNAFKKIGPLKWDSIGAYFVANGFTMGTHPPSWGKCPADQRFITIDKDGKLVPREAGGVCPSTVYLEKSYFRDMVVPCLAETASTRDCYMVNWEPNQYFGKGCFCTNCLAEFAASIGAAEADVASDWPACVRTGGRFFEKALDFRARQHGRLIKTLDKTIRKMQGPKSKGFCPELVWTEVTGDMLEDPLSREVAAKEYVGSLEWLNAWGPYVCWNAARPYMREKRRGVAEWAGAKAVFEHVRSVYGRNPKLISFPSGMQGIRLVATPEWLGLCMDCYLLNGWEGSLVYYMRGLDVRWWRKFAESTTRAAYYEDYVIDGVRRDESTSLRTVKEYASPCHQVSAYLLKAKDVSPLQAATYDLKGGRIVGVVNFWEEGAAFFRLSTRGLAAGEYTVVSDRETLWTKPDGGHIWTAEELERGFAAGVGAARTKVFEIRPAAEHAESAAKNRQTPAGLNAEYIKLRPQLEKMSERDREEESGRTNLCPDGLLMI